MNLDFMVFILEIIYQIKRGWAYVINLDEYCDIGIHQIYLFALKNNVIYFDNFGVEHIQKEIKIFIDKSIFAGNIWNTSMCFNNVLIFFYWIYWFYACM